MSSKIVIQSLSTCVLPKLPVCMRLFELSDNLPMLMRKWKELYQIEDHSTILMSGINFSPIIALLRATVLPTILSPIKLKLLWNNLAFHWDCCSNLDNLIGTLISKLLRVGSICVFTLLQISHLKINFLEPNPVPFLLIMLI